MTKNGCCDGMDLNKKAKASFKKIVGRYFRGQDIKTHTTVKIPCHILNGTRSTWWKGWFMVYTTTTVFTKMWPVSECVACGAWCVSWLLTCSLTSSLSVKLFYRMSHINSCGCCWVHLIPAPLVCVCLSVGPGNVWLASQSSQVSRTATRKLLWSDKSSQRPCVPHLRPPVFTRLYYCLHC